MINLEAFESLVHHRRSVRMYRADPLPAGLLERLLDLTRWAPSGYNLQPTHFVVVTDPALKKKLHAAAMNQQQIVEAPATVVFTGDRQVYEHNFKKMLAAELAAGAIPAAYAAKMHKHVKRAFDHGPGRLGWLWKAGVVPFLRTRVPIPHLPAVDKRFWLAKQVALSAMIFMLAATAAGLSTVPMEGFDEERVRRTLRIPRPQVVLLLISIGYAAELNPIKTRLPLSDLLHINGW